MFPHFQSIKFIFLGRTHIIFHDLTHIYNLLQLPKPAQWPPSTTFHYSQNDLLLHATITLHMLPPPLKLIHSTLHWFVKYTVLDARYIVMNKIIMIPALSIFWLTSKQKKHTCIHILRKCYARNKQGSIIQNIRKNYILLAWSAKGLPGAIHFNLGHGRGEEIASKRIWGQKTSSPKALKQKGTWHGPRTGLNENEQWTKV